MKHPVCGFCLAELIDKNDTICKCPKPDSPEKKWVFCCDTCLKRRRIDISPNSEEAGYETYCADKECHCHKSAQKCNECIYAKGVARPFSSHYIDDKSCIFHKPEVSQEEENWWCKRVDCTAIGDHSHTEPSFIDRKIEEFRNTHEWALLNEKSTSYSKFLEYFVRTALSEAFDQGLSEGQSDPRASDFEEEMIKTGRLAMKEEIEKMTENLYKSPETGISTFFLDGYFSALDKILEAIRNKK